MLPAGHFQDAIDPPVLRATFIKADTISVLLSGIIAYSGRPASNQARVSGSASAAGSPRTTQ
jgi:hypothetical protein